MPPKILTGDAALRREARLQQREDRLSTKNADLKAEVFRLRKLVEEAYREGFRDEWTFFNEDFEVEVENGWNRSQVRAASQAKEGDQ